MRGSNIVYPYYDMGNLSAWFTETISNSDEPIKQYNDKTYKIDFVKRGKYKKKQEELFIGFEIEFELPPETNNRKRNELADKINKGFPNLIAACKHDGSLCNGFECVSHPIHIGYIFTKQFKKEFHNLIELLQSYNACVCTTTGLHFHVSNKYLESTNNGDHVKARLLLMSHHFSNELKQISGRYEAKRYRDIYGSLPNEDDGCFEEFSDEMDDFEDCPWRENELFRYCMFITNECNITPISFEYLDTRSLGSRLTTGHRSAINFGNTSTTEFRFFAGTFDYDTFIRNVSLVVAMCDMAMDIRKNEFTFGNIVDRMVVGSEYIKDVIKDLSTKFIDYAFINDEMRNEMIEKKVNKLIEFNEYLVDNMYKLLKTYKKDYFFQREYITSLIYRISTLGCDVSKLNKEDAKYNKRVNRIMDDCYQLINYLGIILSMNDNIVKNTKETTGLGLIEDLHEKARAAYNG